MTFRTWHAEYAVVATILVAVNLATGRGGVEWLAAAAVMLSFGHATIVDRMAERQATMPRPDVECYYKAARYFMAKELLWVAYFLASRSYAALVGCGIFLAYPIWRRWYRRRKPVK